MGTAKEDFERFVRWLHQPGRNVREDVLRFANLVLADFAGTSGTFRQHNRRSHHLASLARRALADTTAEAPAAPAGNPAQLWPWRSLRQLTVGPFRGFRREEILDLRKRVLLFYGPNGSGKTSLCEALEYSLLGSVQEAEFRRIEDQEYFTNIHAHRFVAPRLVAIDQDNHEVPVIPNAEIYRFCFVEKNRIDAFARIAARPPAARTELIATLFGMEQFNEFASHFNETMDPALVLDAENERTLHTRRQSLARDEQTVAGAAATLLSLDQQESAFAETCRPGGSYANLKLWIGSAEAPGRLQALDGILNILPPAIVGITREGLRASYTLADAAADRLGNATQQLAARSQQVSFKDLYGAVLALQPAHAESCPACDTPLNAVATNPYQRATEGLRALHDLAVLQESAARSRTHLEDAERSLRAELNRLQTTISPEHLAATPVDRYLAGLAPHPQGDRWWQDIYALDGDNGNNADSVSLARLLEIASNIEERDLATRVQLQERHALVQERDTLLQWQLLVHEHDLVRQSRMTNIAEARERIVRFDQDNAALIQQVERERQNISRDRLIKAAYDQFLPLLRQFRNELPGVLMEGLSDLARDLYNEFNHTDPDADKLAALHLPLTGTQRIQVAYRAEPQRRLDALAVLSEGHIRCLGLAILLAKAVTSRCGLIIFDDAINAIDHDHRSGIRQTIFESDRFRDIQILLTCHSSEFIKDIHNFLPVHSRNDWGEYVFRHHAGDHHPQVTGNEISRGYVPRARAAKDALEDREALALGRRALEMLSHKIWRWLESYGHGDIQIELYGPSAEPTLRNMCDQLRRAANDPNFAHAEKASLVAALDVILGIPQQNHVWIYLNKGTHEEVDREDFDAVHVDTVIRTLEQLDQLALRRAR